MTKRRQQNGQSKISELQSPLTADLERSQGELKKAKKNDNNYSEQKRKQQKSKKRAKKEAQEDLEEQNLTNLIFGGETLLSEAKHDIDSTNQNENSLEEAERIDDQQDEFAFQIDRTGGEDEEDSDNEFVERTPATRLNKAEDDDDDDSDSDGEGRDNDADAPAWEDEDDVELSLIESSNRLKKLRKSRQETKALSSSELEERLRERYQRSTQAAARTDWAKAGTVANDQQQIKEEDQLAANLFSTSSSLLASSIHRLPPNILKVVRCPDANQADPNKAVVQAVHFHPASDPDQPLMLTAGLDKTLRFFQIGEESSQKIHGIHCKYCCSFIVVFCNSGQIVELTFLRMIK